MLASTRCVRNACFVTRPPATCSAATAGSFAQRARGWSFSITGGGSVPASPTTTRAHTTSGNAVRVAAAESCVVTTAPAIHAQNVARCSGAIFAVAATVLPAEGLLQHASAAASQRAPSVASSRCSLATRVGTISVRHAPTRRCSAAAAVGESAAPFVRRLSLVTVAVTPSARFPLAPVSLGAARAVVLRENCKGFETRQQQGACRGSDGVCAVQRRESNRQDKKSLKI